MLANAQQKPNIIYILADDLGYGDISYLNEHSKIATPNINKLANEGMSFTDAHASSSVCSPSRYSILTGRYAWRSQLKSGVLGLYDAPLIEKNRLTVGMLLQQNGYTTAAIGKWHLGWDWPLTNGSLFKDSLFKGNDSEKDRFRIEKNINFSARLQNGPITKGFDYYFGDDVPNYPPYCYIENDQTVGVPNLLKPKYMYGHDGLMLQGWKLENVMLDITKKAVQFVDEKKTSSKPFFLYLALTAPHTPIAPADAFKGKSKAGFYGDYVQEIDWTVGEVMNAVKKAGLENNTIIIFTSDNGSPGNDGTDMDGGLNTVNRFDHFPSYTFRGIKADIWEGGHHVPFIVKWPGKIKNNSSESSTVCHADLMATCADLVHVKLPDNAGEDSYSLMPLLINEKQKKYQREFTIHHSHAGYFAIRKGDWKLIMCAGSGGWTSPKPGKEEDGLPVVQLYNMKNDLSEKENLQSMYPEKVIELKKLLTKSIKEGRTTKGTVQSNIENFYPHTLKWLNEGN